MTEKSQVGSCINILDKSSTLTMVMNLNYQDFSHKLISLIFRQHLLALNSKIRLALHLPLQQLHTRWLEEPSKWDGDLQLQKLLFLIRIKSLMLHQEYSKELQIFSEDNLLFLILNLFLRKEQNIGSKGQNNSRKTCLTRLLSVLLWLLIVSQIGNS